MGPQMLELTAVAVALLGLWLMLLAQSWPPSVHKVVLFIPVYALVSYGCYALGLLGYGVMVFPTCKKEAELLQKDIATAKEYYAKQGLKVVQTS